MIGARDVRGGKNLLSRGECFRRNQNMHFARCHRLLALSILLLTEQPMGEACQAAEKHFTAQDEIELYHFGDPHSGHPDAVFFSPDRRYFVVIAEHGLVRLNQPEVMLRVYSSQRIRKFLSNQVTGTEPAALWIWKSSTFREGPLVTNLRWLADSESFAFLLRTSSGRNQLVLADVKRRMVEALTRPSQDVTAFDIRDRRHFVYSVWDAAPLQRARLDRSAASVVGTGRPLRELLFSDDRQMFTEMYDRSELWAVIDGKRLVVHDSGSDQILHLYLKGQEALALSPNGRFVVTARAVRVIPKSWEVLFPPPTPTSVYRIRAGQQDLSSPQGMRYASEYVILDLLRGSSESLADAPMGESAGWYGAASAAWSPDGQSVVLSNTFLGREDHDSESRPVSPCVAVVDVRRQRKVCLNHRDKANNENYIVEGVEFAPGNPRQVNITVYKDGKMGREIYVRNDDGFWGLREGPEVREGTEDRALLHVAVKERFDSPPVLMATDKTSKESSIIWNPNPQLQRSQLSDVSVFHWKDQTGRDWTGGLYKPIGYLHGNRYPFVIQTHGFREDEFEPSGAFPTAFAAQQLASAGFVVLQVRDCPGRVTPDEGPCNVEGYRSAVQTLAEEGMIDPERVGIVGFSRTCFYVMEALTSGSVHFKAALITDGVNEGYLQYLLAVDDSGNALAREADAMNGASPFGEGLRNWLKNSPEFNLDKVEAPLQIVASGRGSTLFMWEPYAVLRYLHKPVDLIIINSPEHVLTNPAARLVSQGGTVDWFRFWLKGEENSDPAKIPQYARWRTLRDCVANREIIPPAASEASYLRDRAQCVRSDK